MKLEKEAVCLSASQAPKADTVSEFSVVVDAGQGETGLVD